jgi:hypothetical protein
MTQRRPRKLDPDHCAFVRSLPCLICGDDISTECAHVRFNDARVAKFNPGVGQRPDDRFTLPLCNDCHQGNGGQHGSGERKWWEARGIDPILIALALYSVSGNAEEAALIIKAQRDEPGLIMTAG